MISVCIPTYGRADRLAAVAANVHATTGRDHEVVFIVEQDDTDSVEAAVDTGARVVVNERTRSYSGAMNTAYHQGLRPLVFAGADDLRFHPRWDDHAIVRLDEQILVVGTNDLLNPYVAKGWHATHYLIDRRYLDLEGGTVDGGPGSWYHEGYSHNYTDTEFIGTAKARCRFRPCLSSIVEHVHDKHVLHKPDATTAKTEEHVGTDSELYDSRRHLWWELSR